MASFAKEVAKDVPDVKNAYLFEYIDRENIIKNSEFIVRGPYALQKIYYFGDDDIFELNGKIFAFGADYQQDSLRITKIVIPYRDNETAEKIFKRLTGRLDSLAEIILSDKDRLIFKDYKGEYSSIRLNNNKLFIKLHLLEVCF